MLKEQAGASQPGVKLNAGQHLAASATAGANKAVTFACNLPNRNASQVLLQHS